MAYVAFALAVIALAATIAGYALLQAQSALIL